MTETKEKIKTGNFSDNRIIEFHDVIIDAVIEKATELQMQMALVVGCLDNIKHDIQHEYTTIPESTIDYNS